MNITWQGSLKGYKQLFKNMLIGIWQIILENFIF